MVNLYSPQDCLALEDKLPAEARVKLRAFKDCAEDNSALVRSSMERLALITRQLAACERERTSLAGELIREGQLTQLDTGSLRALRGHTSRPATDEENARRLAPIDAEIAALTEDHAHVESRRALAAASTSTALKIIRNVHVWLSEVPPGISIAADRAPVKARDRVTLDAIERIRRRVRELTTVVREIDAAPFHAARAKEVWRARIDAIAERGRPQVGRMIDRLDQPVFPTVSVQARGPDLQLVDGFSVMAWLHRDQLIAAGEAEIDADADDANAFTDEERRAKFQEALGDLLATEREEEALIAAASFEIDRRPDADPRAVLGLAGDLPSPHVRNLFHRALAL